MRAEETLDSSAIFDQFLWNTALAESSGKFMNEEDAGYSSDDVNPSKLSLTPKQTPDFNAKESPLSLKIVFDKNKENLDHESDYSSQLTDLQNELKKERELRASLEEKVNSLLRQQHNKYAQDITLDQWDS